jgi:adenylosuccinate synthase
MVDDVSTLLAQLRKAGKRVLFEGAQGSLLDIDHGTYPYVTSSEHHGRRRAARAAASAPTPSTTCSASARPMRRASAAVPFPTELNDEVGEGLRACGHEFGATTGRPRRCGWIDAGGAAPCGAGPTASTGSCITKLDVLDGMPTIRIWAFPSTSSRQVRIATRRSSFVIRLHDGLMSGK